MQWKWKNRVRHLRNQARSVGCGGEEGERLGQTRLVPCFPHPSPVIYNRKTSIPPTRWKFDKLLSIYQTRVANYYPSFLFSSFSRKKLPSRNSFPPPLTSFLSPFAKTINYQHRSRFLLSRESNPIPLRIERSWKRGQPDASVEILWSRDGIWKTGPAWGIETVIDTTFTVKTTAFQSSPYFHRVITYLGGV